MENARKVLADEPIENVTFSQDCQIKFYKSYMRCYVLDHVERCVEVFDVLVDLKENSRYRNTYTEHPQFDFVYPN